jgi:hypothetical protein
MRILILLLLFPIFGYSQQNGVFQTIKTTKTSVKIDEFSSILTGGNANAWQNDNVPTGKAVVDLVNLKTDTLRGNLVEATMKTVTTTNATPLELDTFVVANNKVGVFDIEISSSDNGTVNFWHKKVIIKNVGGTRTILYSGNVVFVDTQASTISIAINGGGLPVLQITGVAATNIKWSSMKVSLLSSDL